MRKCLDLPIEKYGRICYTEAGIPQKLHTEGRTMAETYCGKNCSECAEYQNSLCPGCRQGPGSWLGNDCDIAQCARDKGCATCLGCDSEKTCILCAGASVMPERRKQRAAAKEAGQALRRQRKDVGKWLWIYFWMLIPSLIVSFMTNNTGAARAEIPGGNSGHSGGHCGVRAAVPALQGGTELRLCGLGNGASDCHKCTGCYIPCRVF